MAVIAKELELVGSKGRAKVTGLFDSGATYSFIQKELAGRLATLEPLAQALRFATAKEGEAVEVRERVVVDFFMDGYRFSDEFLVIEKLSEPVLIGATTMQKWRFRLDLEREEVIIDPRVTRLRFI